jgi:hypothetical protein
MFEGLAAEDNGILLIKQRKVGAVVKIGDMVFACVSWLINLKAFIGGVGLEKPPIWHLTTTDVQKRTFRGSITGYLDLLPKT